MPLVSSHRALVTFLLVVATALLLVALGGPRSGPSPALAGPAGSSPVYAGVTTATFSVSAGYDVMNAACETEFTATRMCLDTWLLHTFPAPVPGVEALMQLSITAMDDEVKHYTGAGIRVVSSTVSATSDLNCANTGLFTTTSQYDRFGYMDALGNFRSAGCDVGTTYAIACCGL